MKLPTDTVHLRLRTRQYELFGRPLGRGVERRVLLIGSSAAAAWWLLLLAAGMPLLHRLSPLVFLVPPVVFALYGTRRDDTGRMAVLRWWDWILYRFRGRRAVLRNPLMVTDPRPATPTRLMVTTELGVTGHRGDRS